MVGAQILSARQVGTIAITSLLVFLTSLAVALRFIARRIAGQRIFADDYVMLAALVREQARKLNVLSVVTSLSSF